MIPYSRQEIDDDDIAAVVDVLRGDFLTTGPTIDAFEQALVHYTGARHAVVMANGTAALHAALAAADIGEGDTVATTTISFSASANCARYVGAGVRLVDIDPATRNIDLARLPPCEALIAVHFTGLPVDLAGLEQRPRVVIEDAAQALGAHTPDGPVGNCAHSDMTTFSFHPVKSITTGEGGAVTTNDDKLAERLRRFRSHGIVRTDEHHPWAYDISELGHNFRLTDIQAALGLSQLAKLDRFVDARRALADRYRELLSGVDEVTLPPMVPRGFRSAWHLFAVEVPDRLRVYTELRAAEIGVQIHHVPIHTLTIHSGAAPDGCPAADRYYAGTMSLPLFPSLSHEQQNDIVAKLVSSVRNHS